MTWLHWLAIAAVSGYALIVMYLLWQTARRERAQDHIQRVRREYRGRYYLMALSLGWVLGIFTVGIPWTATSRDRDALRAMVTALREGGDGSCAVKNNGPYIICWMEDGYIKQAFAPVKAKSKRKLRTP